VHPMAVGPPDKSRNESRDGTARCRPASGLHVHAVTADANSAAFFARSRGADVPRRQAHASWRPGRRPLCGVDLRGGPHGRAAIGG
jgi:hypothetical protein